MDISDGTHILETCNLVLVYLFINIYDIGDTKTKTCSLSCESYICIAKHSFQRNRNCRNAEKLSCPMGQLWKFDRVLFPPKKWFKLTQNCLIGGA